MTFSFQPSENNDMIHYAKGSTKSDHKYISRTYKNGKWYYKYGDKNGKNQLSSEEIKRINQTNKELKKNNPNDIIVGEYKSDNSGIKQYLVDDERLMNLEGDEYLKKFYDIYPEFDEKGIKINSYQLRKDKYKKK